MNRLDDAMDDSADKEARCNLAHWLAGWLESLSADELEKALAAWESSR